MTETEATSTYPAAYASWQADPEAWWAEAAEGIDWTRRWDRVFDPGRGAAGQWFAGGMLNVRRTASPARGTPGAASRPR